MPGPMLGCRSFCGMATGCAAKVLLLLLPEMPAMWMLTVPGAHAHAENPVGSNGLEPMGRVGNRAAMIERT